MSLEKSRPRLRTIQPRPLTRSERAMRRRI